MGLNIAIDTNIIVAAVATWQESHSAARRAIERLSAENTLIVPLHALMEESWVCTRLPRPYRAKPRAAFRSIRELVGAFAVVALSSNDVWPLLETLANRSISGGRIYDAAIARAARAAGAEAILTINIRKCCGEGLEVLSP